MLVSWYVFRPHHPTPISTKKWFRVYNLWLFWTCVSYNTILNINLNSTLNQGKLICIICVAFISPQTPQNKSQIHAQSSTPEAEFYRLKSARRAEVVLALHHIEEDGNGILPELRLWHQRDLQNGADHGGDELHFVRAWGTANIIVQKYYSMTWEVNMLPLRVSTNRGGI